MSKAERARPKRGRTATASWLRVLAALVALVLSASALGQAAHFMLVPHAICAEHGELLELDEGAAHAAHERAGNDAAPHAASPDLAVEHEHCQHLARGQREQALPAADGVELPPAAHDADAASLLGPRRVVPQRTGLALAPKTSPPRSPSC